MAIPHDGDTFLLRGGDSPLYAEWLNTNGRLGVRLTDRFGRGILLERDCMTAFLEILKEGLAEPTPDMV